MRIALTLALGLSFGAPQLAAQELTVAEWATLPRMIDSVCLELMEGPDGCERVMLLSSVQEPDSADLVILPNALSQGSEAPLAVVRGVAYAGSFFGQRPVLEAAPDGGLLIREEQVAIGRHPWEQIIHIVHSGAAFRVAGQTYSTYDRPAGGSFACEVDYLNRRWTISAERVNTDTGETTHEVSDNGDLSPSFPVLAQWRLDRGLPPVCETALSAWFDAAPQ